VKDSRRQGSPEATGGLRLDAKDRERLNVLVKEMFRPAELVERIRRLVHGRPPVIIPALDSTFGACKPELPLSPEAAGG
jgi:hypothetical protein